jgi:hypothetical protein
VGAAVDRLGRDVPRCSPALQLRHDEVAVAVEVEVVRGVEDDLAKLSKMPE